MNNTGILIRAVRKKSGLTMRDLAAVLDVSHTAIAAWETGIQLIPSGRIRGVLIALPGLSAEDLDLAWRADYAARMLARADAILAKAGA